MAYVLMLWFWSDGHIVHRDMVQPSYEVCVQSGKTISDTIPTTWVCVPEGK